MKNFNSKVLTCAFLVVLAVKGQTTGSISGVVVENGSRPLAGATVVYTGSPRVETDSRGRQQYARSNVAGSVQTRTDGTFTITGLPADTYSVCARGNLPVQIASCSWNNSPYGLSVALVPGQNQTGLQLNVTRGALLDITVVDSTGCAARSSKAPVYVFAGTMSHQARLLSIAPGAFHYQALVPQQVPLKVSSNHGCSFADASGNDLAGRGLQISPIQGESASVTMTAR